MGALSTDGTHPQPRAPSNECSLLPKLRLVRQLNTTIFRVGARCGRTSSPMPFTLNIQTDAD